MVSRLDRNFYQKTKFLKTMAVCLHNKKSRGSSSEPRLSVNTTLLPHRAHLPGATVSSLAEQSGPTWRLSTEEGMAKR